MKILKLTKTAFSCCTSIMNGFDKINNFNKCSINTKKDKQFLIEEFFYFICPTLVLFILQNTCAPTLKCIFLSKIASKLLLNEPLHRAQTFGLSCCFACSTNSSMLSNIESYSKVI